MWIFKLPPWVTASLTWRMQLRRQCLRAAGDYSGGGAGQSNADCSVPPRCIMSVGDHIQRSQGWIAGGIGSPRRRRRPNIGFPTRRQPRIVGSFDGSVIASWKLGQCGFATAITVTSRSETLSRRRTARKLRRLIFNRHPSGVRAISGNACNDALALGSVVSVRLGSRDRQWLMGGVTMAAFWSANRAGASPRCIAALKTLSPIRPIVRPVTRDSVKSVTRAGGGIKKKREKTRPRGRGVRRAKFLSGHTVQKSRLTFPTTTVRARESSQRPIDALIKTPLPVLVSRIGAREYEKAPSQNSIYDDRPCKIHCGEPRTSYAEHPPNEIFCLQRLPRCCMN